MLGGFRYYYWSAVEHVRFIKRAQTLGFSLDKVMGLLDLQQKNVCKETHDAAVLKLKLVEERIEDLVRIRTTIQELVKQCKAGPASTCCPIIESLSHR